MTKTVKINIISDLQGNVLAAEIPDENTEPEGQAGPISKGLVPLKGQLALSIEVPAELLSLPGPEMYQYLSGIDIQWPAKVQLPNVSVIGRAKK